LEGSLLGCDHLIQNSIYVFFAFRPTDAFQIYAEFDAKWRQNTAILTQNSRPRYKTKATHFALVSGKYSRVGRICEGIMYGVVLWSDHCQNRAVIWCEDHGDLAYYEGGPPETHAGPELDPGDLVRFDISEGKRMRTVSNPRVVANDQYPTLAGDLARVGAQQTTALPQTGDAARAAAASKVIPLQPLAGTISGAARKRRSTA
jgi:hypothetical protein